MKVRLLVVTFAIVALTSLCVLLLAGRQGSLVAQGSADKEREIVSAWTIGVYTGQSPFELSQPSGLTNPVLTGADVSDMEINILAHPFVVAVDSAYHLFFTAKHDKLKQGGIGSARSSDGLHWKYNRIVLDEPYDLSYPYVFSWRGEYYMIPEAHTETTLRLYRATDFPDKWERECDLLTGDHYISTTVVRYKEMWWMFTARLGNETLRLFYAENLKGPWSEHPQSPIVEQDLNTARPAGRPLVIDGTLYRLGQDCDPTYGNSVHAFRITDLSTSAYSEQMVQKPLIKATSSGWNAEAMHHVDALRTADGKWIAIVDALGGIPR
jgi:hypothetical protein